MVVADKLCACGNIARDKCYELGLMASDQVGLEDSAAQTRFMMETGGTVSASVRGF
jgi:hypothetical protein